MGLNSLSDYWDTADHEVNDPLREKDPGATRTRQPYRDYAMRVQGEALYDLNQNFVNAWDHPQTKSSRLFAKKSAPLALHEVRVARTAQQLGDALAPEDGVLQCCQVLRTEPREGEAHIWQAYQLALSNARRYIYAENQYFQLPEFVQAIKQQRKAYLDLYDEAGGKGIKKVPPLNLFVVIPNPTKSFWYPAPTKPWLVWAHKTKSPPTTNTSKTKLANTPRPGPTTPWMRPKKPPWPN